MTMDNTTSNFCWRLILFSFGVILSAVALPVAKHIWAFTNTRQTSTENLYATYVPVKSKLKQSPASIARAFDVFCCPGGWEFDEVSLPRGRGVGVGNLIASFDFMLRHVDSTWRDKSWRRQALMHSKRKIPDSWRTGWKAKACTSFFLYLKVFKNHLYYLWHVRVLS